MPTTERPRNPPSKCSIEEAIERQEIESVHNVDKAVYAVLGPYEVAFRCVHVPGAQSAVLRSGVQGVGGE